MSKTFVRERHWLIAVSLSLLAQNVVPPVAGAQNVDPPDREARANLLQLPGSVARPAPSLDSETADAPSVLTPWSRVVHQSYRDGNAEIYVANDDGSAELRLTNSPDADIHPDLNRGATRVAYANRSGDYEIRSMNVDGGDNRALTDNASDDGAPDWSPDGTKIAFQAYRDGQSEIYVMQANGSGQTRLTNDAGYDGQPAWSPDGTKIAFVSTRSGGARIWVMNADGGGAHMVSTQASGYDPSWSPDGTKIGYDADGNGDGWQELWVMNVDGSNAHMLLNIGTNQDLWAGNWSPNGRYLSYTHIAYVYYQNAWYWTEARIGAFDTTVATGYYISSSNEAMNPDWQSQDIVAPVATLLPMPAVSPAPLSVSWSASDGGPSGLHSYDVQWSEGGGPWANWLQTWTMTSAWFPDATGGHTYSFRIRARDRANNVSDWSAPVSTTIEALAPDTAVSGPAFADGPITLTWGGTDPGGSGITTYDVQMRVAPNGSWTDAIMNTTMTSILVLRSPGEIIDYRVRARDRAQNVEEWPAGDGDLRVTFYSWKVAGPLHDNAGVPIAAAQVDALPLPLGTTASAGTYAAYGLVTTPSYVIDWSKTGYGDLPQTTINTGPDVDLDMALPPVDSVVQNGTFESGTFSPNWTANGTLPTGLSTTIYHTGGASAWLGAEADTAWAAPATVDTFTSGNQYWYFMRKPRFAIDHAGVQHAVWNRGVDSSWDTQVWYARKAPGEAWSAPIQLSSNPVQGAAAIAIDSADRVHVVWMGTTSYYTMWASGQGWSAPVALPFQRTTSAEIAVDASNTVHIVAAEYTTDAYTPGRLVYARSAGGPWSQPEHVLTGGDLPALVVDANGVPHVLAYATIMGTTGPIQHLQRVSTNVWSQETVSPARGYAPDVAIDEAGVLHAVWRNSEDFKVGIAYSSKAPGQGWTAPTYLRLSHDAAEPQIAARGGRVAITFVDQIPDIVLSELFYTYREDSGSAWSSPRRLTYEATGTLYSELRLGPGGEPCVLYEPAQQGYSSNTPISLKAIDLVRTASAGQAQVSQAVTVSPSLKSPALAFHYQLHGASPTPGTLQVQLQTGSGTVDLVALGETAGWAFKSIDLSAWAGQTITVIFRLDQTAGAARASALIDDVSIGSTHPDVWVAVAATIGRRGQPVTYTLTYGNQGGAPATDVRIHFVLPAGLTFVSASVAPTGVSPDLFWDVGTVGAHAGPTAVTLVALVTADVQAPAQLTHSAQIESASGQLETWNDQSQAVTVIEPHKVFIPTLGR